MRYRIEEVKLGLDEALVVNNAARAIKVEGRTAVICDEPILLTKLSKKLSGIILPCRRSSNLIMMEILSSAIVPSF